MVVGWANALSYRPILTVIEVAMQDESVTAGYDFVPWDRNAMIPDDVPKASLRVVPIIRHDMVRLHFPASIDFASQSSFLTNAPVIVLERYQKASNQPLSGPENEKESGALWVDCDFETHAWHWDGHEYGLDGRIRDSWLGERLGQALQKSGKWPKIRAVCRFGIRGSECELERALILGLQRPRFPPKDKWKLVPLSFLYTREDKNAAK